MIDGFGAIKAGHTGWMQADLAAQNILNLIRRKDHPEEPVEPLKEYTPGKPQIKLTLGLVRGSFDTGRRVFADGALEQSCDANCQTRQPHGTCLYAH